MALKRAPRVHYKALGADERYIRMFRYFDDVWQLLLVHQSNGQEWKASHAKLINKGRLLIYPTSLHLIFNIGPSAEMLACSTFVHDGVLHCVHWCKNAKACLTTGRPRFAHFGATHIHQHMPGMVEL